MPVTSLPILTSITVIFGVLFAAYGIWVHRLSGFEFYTTAGLFAGLSLIGAGALVLIIPDWYDLILFIGVGVVVIPVKSLWEEAQERRVCKSHPLEWINWENTLAHQRAWARWLLFPIQRRIHLVGRESRSSLG
jgi:hypothetical protein